MKAFVLAKLISAMIFVESGGDPLSFNAREQAAGVLQIRPIMVAEFNRIGIEFTLEDRYSQYKSVETYLSGSHSLHQCIPHHHQSPSLLFSHHVI